MFYSLRDCRNMVPCVGPSYSNSLFSFKSSFVDLRLVSGLGVGPN